MADAERRWWLWGCRPDESRLDLMLVEIVSGIAKSAARSIRDDDDAAQWDRTARWVATIQARGGIAVCNNGDD